RPEEPRHAADVALEELVAELAIALLPRLQQRAIVELVGHALHYHRLSSRRASAISARSATASTNRGSSVDCDRSTSNSLLKKRNRCAMNATCWPPTKIACFEVRNGKIRRSTDAPCSCA